MKGIYEVSSVTNAMRGKRALEKQGIHAFVQRRTETDGKNGCGYVLLVPEDTERVTTVLRAEGLRFEKIKSRERK